MHRTARSLFTVSADWVPSTPRRQVQPLIDWVNDTWAAVGVHATDSAYQNFIDPALRDWKRAYYGANLHRLIRVKRAYDPDELFKFPQSIPA